MRLREPFVKKHIHRWMLTGKRPQPNGVIVSRRCDDCNKKQYGMVYSTDVVPDSVLQLADAVWYDGEASVWDVPDPTLW